MCSLKEVKLLKSRDRESRENGKKWMEISRWMSMLVWVAEVKSSTWWAAEVKSSRMRAAEVKSTKLWVAEVRLS